MRGEYAGEISTVPFFFFSSVGALKCVSEVRIAAAVGFINSAVKLMVLFVRGSGFSV